MKARLKQIILSTGNILEHLGLALMIGGMLALGAFTAPAVFHNFPADEAGRVMTMIFRRYDAVLTVSLVFIILGEASRLFITGFARKWLFTLRYGVAILLIVLSTLSLTMINPQLEAYQKTGVRRFVGEEGKDFDQLHKQSENLYKSNLALGVTLLILISL